MRARSWALQILYAWESQGEGEPPLEVMKTVFETRRISSAREPFVARLVAAVGEHLERIDTMIEETAENWRLDRFSRIDRSILRLSVAEMLFVGDTPPKVVIQEAIRLAGQFGGAESPRFVNGILDAIYRSHGRGGEVPDQR